MAENTPSTKGLGKELGSSGTFIQSGIITQEEYNKNLIGIKAVRTYDTMRRSDATVRAALQVCKLPIMSAERTVEAASDDNQDQFVADFVKRELTERNVNFDDMLRQALTMLDFGYSVNEKTFELTTYEGKTLIGIKKIGFRKQTSIEKWEIKDGKAGITQRLLADLIEIPIEKLLVFTHEKEGDNHEGISLLRSAYKHWHIKDKLDLVNAVAIEKMAIGVPVLKKPNDADVGELDRARDALRNFRGNEEGYQEIPTGWELEMLDMKSNSNKEVIPTIQYHDRQIMKAVLAQFLELGASDASGSRAVSQDHSALFFKALEAVAKNVAATINEQLIKQLCDLNFSELPNGYPKLVFGKLGDEDITITADAIQKFMTAGALTAEPEVENHVRKILKLPEMPEEIKANYEEKLKAEQAIRQSTIENAANPQPSQQPPTGKNADNIKPDDKKKLKASILAAAEKSRNQLIDLLFEV